jgi:monoamine oxidase
VRRWADAPPDELERAVLDHLARLFGPDAKSPTHFVSKSWPAERWSEGCYTSILAPGTLTELGAALRKPSGRLHWAGTETARDGTGYFEGAIEAGERAAREVIERLAGA